MRMSAACTTAAWYIAGMKKPLTVSEFVRMGGKARAQKLSPERRKQIASEAGKKGGRPRKATLREVSPCDASFFDAAGQQEVDISCQARAPAHA